MKKNFREKLFIMASENPEFRKKIIPILKQAFSKTAGDITRIEVLDTKNDDRQVQGIRGDQSKFDGMLERYKSPRYTVQGKDSSGKIVIDNLGINGKVRKF